MIGKSMLVFTAGLFVATTAHAQGNVVSPVRTPAGGGVMVGVIESKVTTDRPYSADAITETIQVLADGNRISRTLTTKIYRDAAGRTRREVLGVGSVATTVSISDPVAKTGFTLDPKTKTAFKTGGTVVMPVPAGEGTYIFSSAGGGTGGSSATATLRSTRPAPAPSGGGGGGRGGAVASRVRSEDSNVKTEDLGSRNIEGVLATGTRTTTTIPAGQIGNDKDITIVSERWFSDELQVLVMTRHNDPRSGETTYQLRNILRAEPDASLFTVPADYTIQERRIRKPE